MNPKQDEDTYEFLGPLTDDELARLDAMSSDDMRRTTLNNWYGRKASAYAWKIYLGGRLERRLKREAKRMVAQGRLQGNGSGHILP